MIIFIIPIFLGFVLTIIGFCVGSSWRRGHWRAQLGVQQAIFTSLLSKLTEAGVDEGHARAKRKKIKRNKRHEP